MNPTDRKTRAALRQAFEARYGALGSQPLRCALAPGRVNLIGEHTDYNGGFVLPLAIARHTAVLYRPNPEARVRIHSAAIAQEDGQAGDEFGLQAAAIPRLKDPKRHWANYVRGVAVALLKRGVALHGGDLYITADLPQGAGLSSSASLEVAAALALLDLSGAPDMDRQQLALACQEAEHTYAGVRCGIMDQTVVACAKEGHALLLDCVSLNVRQVPVRLQGWGFAVFDTGVRHKLAGSEYNKRRAECEHVAQLCGARTLRDVTIEHLVAHAREFSASEHRRLRHVLSENVRTLQFAAALERGDTAALAELLADGHRSLRRDYEVSCTELDFLAATLSAPGKKKGPPACLAARMTGGGFGGSVVALLRAGRFEALRTQAARRFKARFGKPPGGALPAAPGGGAHILEV